MRLTDTLVEEGLTVRETISDFLSDCELRSLADGTIEWYRQRLGSLLADILDQPISALSLPEIRERIRGVQNMHSASTVKGYVRAVKTFCYWSLREGNTIVEPRMLPRIKEPSRLPPTLTPEQVEALLAQPDRKRFTGLRDLAIMAIMLDTGMRVGEVAQLDLGDLDPPTITIIGKGNKQRRVAMSQPMQKLLAKYLRARARVLQDAGLDVPYLWVSRTGVRLTRWRIAELVRAYGKSAGIEGVRVSPHTLRYTYATEFLRAKGNIVHLQQILGHTTLAMTRRYIVAVDSDAFEESMRLSPVAGMKLG